MRLREFCCCLCQSVCPHWLAFTRRACFSTKLAHSFLSHLCLSFCLPESFTCTSFHPSTSPDISAVFLALTVLSVYTGLSPIFLFCTSLLLPLLFFSHTFSPSKSEDACLLGGVKIVHLRTTINMVALHSGNPDGVVSMDSQVETVPGPQPQRGPPPATGVSDPEHVACKGQSRSTGYNFNICHWNAEGVRTKKFELQTFLKTHNIDVCCIQETHLSPNHRFSVRGFETFRRDREHGPKGGLLILVKNIYPAAEIHRSRDEDTEVLGIKLILEGNPLSIYNLYSPPPKALRLHAIQPEEERWIIMGDFNSHSPSWGYPDLDAKVDEVEDWIITNQMVLSNRPDEPRTYYSRAWRKTSCPDITIATDDVTKTTKRHVEQQLGGSDHKPVLLVIKQDLREAGRKLFPSWNYKRANWPEFRKMLMKTAETR